MKKFSVPMLALALVLLSGCASERPMTEAEQAAKFGLTVEQFREEKKAAARMNMSLEEHMNMIQDPNGMNMMNHNSSL